MRFIDRVEQYSLAPVLDGLDALRQRVLKRGARVCGPFVRDRDLRIVAVAAFACITALAGTALAPGYMLLLGPVVLGVPHLFFESRYLFFQHDRVRRGGLVVVLLAQTVCVFAGFGIYTLGFATIA